MSTQQTKPKSMELTARKVGGIDETTVEFEPGVTVLEGRNATNRTSLLQAIKAACGSQNVSIKSDADRAEVELAVGDRTYRRTLTRKNGTVVADGEAYLDDPKLAELFAFLLENNEARQAVARGENLREIIMRPVDTAAIEAEIKQLEAKKDRIDETLAELNEVESRLPSLEANRTRIRNEIEDKKAEIEDVQDRIDAAETDLKQEREDERAVEEKLSELQGLRGELDDIRYDIETERESLGSLREERAAVKSDLEELPDPAAKDTEDIANKIDSLRNERQRVERKVTELNTVINFNEEMLEESKPHVRNALEGAGSTDQAGDVTDQLLEDDESVACWTCGSSVTAGKIEDTLDLLREVRSDTAARMDEVADSIDELESERDELERRRRRRRDLKNRIERIDDEITDHEASIESLDDRRSDLESEIETVEEELKALRTENQSEVIELHEEANELEFQLGRLQNELDSIEDEIEDIESRMDDREDLQSERERVTAELQELRTRIDSIQTEAIEAFNSHMDTVLDLLEYGNIDKVWIERTEREVRDGRSKRHEPSFELHIVRSPEDDGAYEDTIDNLSESEREVIGLVFALAGYLVHDVDKCCPFILLDSLEAFDAERVGRLVSYLKEQSEYLVVALLPEDARAMGPAYERIEEI